MRLQSISGKPCKLNTDVEKYEKENDLIFTEDSIEAHSGYKEDFMSLLNILDKQQKRRKNGLSMIADGGFILSFSK